MMKKLYGRLTGVFGIMILFFLLMPIVKVEAKEKVYTWGDYTYSIEVNSDGDKRVMLNEYNGQEENLIIPSTINSIKVKSLPKSYKYPDKIRTITMPQYIYIVEGYEFEKFVNLEAIQVPEGSEHIKSVDGVLYDRKGTKLICYPCAKKGTTYTVPEEVTYAADALQNNRYLEKLIIQGKMQWWIGFAENSNIRTVIFSDEIREIDFEAFAGCKKLTTVVMGKNIKVIDSGAFMDCISLKKVLFPKGLTKIEAYAFKNCKSLKEVKIPETVYYINQYAFEKCPAKISTPSYIVKRHGIYRSRVPIQLYKTGKTKYYLLGAISKLAPVDKSISVKKGKSKKLQIIGYRHNKKKGIIDTSILQYTSSNPKIARVSKRGNIKAYQKGKVKVKIEFKPKLPRDSKEKRYCYVTLKVK